MNFDLNVDNYQVQELREIFDSIREKQGKDIMAIF